MTPIRAVSLCSGIGGFDLAAEMAGMTIVGQVEIDPFCRRVLAKYWPHVKRLSDLWEAKGDEFGAIDVLLAGIPCQPFSVAGKQAGTEDTRNLWEPFLSFVEVSRPTFICLENVPGLIRMALDDWLADLGSLGYATLPLAVPAAAVGAPHIRERIFIVAHAEGECGELRQAERAGSRRLAGSSVDVAHASNGRIVPLPGVRGTLERQEGRRFTGNGSVEGGTLEYTGGTGRQERYASAEPGSAGHAAGRCDSVDVADTSGAGRENGRRGQRRWPEVAPQQSSSDCSWPEGGTTEPGLGGIAPGTSFGLDSARGLTWPGWPAPPGQPQHDYEPPRTTDGGKHRRQRLKALGNCVVPAQAYPTLCAIVDAIRAEEETPWEHEETEPPINGRTAATARHSSSSAAKGR